MHVSMLPDDQMQVQFSGPLGRMANGVRSRAGWFLKRVLHLDVGDPQLASKRIAEDLPARDKRQSRVVTIVEVLCQPVLLLTQAVAFVVLAVVCACGLVLWATWRVLCRLIKPVLFLTGISALIGVGALGGFAYSEYRHTAVSASAAADLSDPYGTSALPASRPTQNAPSTLPSLPSSPAPGINELFKTPPASVPAPR